MSREGEFTELAFLYARPSKVCLGDGGDSHMKGNRMPAVSLRGANHGFWFHLGSSEQNVDIVSCQGIF